MMANLTRLVHGMKQIRRNEMVYIEYSKEQILEAQRIFDETHKFHTCETCKWCWWQDDTFDSCDNKKSPVDWINRNKHKGFGCNFWEAK